MEFNADEVIKKFELTDEEFEANINEIFGELSLYATQTENPSFILVGGQAGSGKSGLVAKEYQDLGGNAIIIDQDELRTKFPKEKYKQIHDNYTEREEFLILKPYILKMVFELIGKAKKSGYNVILESALRSTGSFMKKLINTTEGLKENGFSTKLSVIAVPEVEANISMLTRYCYYLKKDGECRRNTRLDSSAVPKLRDNIEKLAELGIFDDITISVRGKEMDSLPVQKYSKKENTELTPLQAYDDGRIYSFNDTRRNFDIRYEQIKAILNQYQDIEQLRKLENIRESFEKEKSEVR